MSILTKGYDDASQRLWYMKAAVASLIAVSKGDTKALADAELMVTKLKSMRADAVRVPTQKNLTGAVIKLDASSVSSDSGVIAGWASTSDRDSYNHEVMAGAFQASIDKRGLTGPKGIKLLLDHDWTKPAGVITTLEYRRGGRLWMEAKLNLDIEYVAERYSYLKQSGGANFSVGFMLEDYEVVTRKVDGGEDQYLRIDRGDLFEVSIVLFPGNEAAQMQSVKAGPEHADTMARLERLQTLIRTAKGQLA
ncbi:HK97 family phage prohead protease [Mesorhizobium sp. B4-1-4]|uniref:HK97 family phage prohead protease n=1 Tax=Mesorhizobium sp. B4-1-4 TaxID=2589888 RepID=UPI00112C9777|nr:HK97 family phage prohead protease [Mesorhizobium sp. B4-1-4]UCI32546.1 HK97 family phage prohead protease [Mesorhizobium sp. B4-1-4]